MSDAAAPRDLSVWLSSREAGRSAFCPGRDLVLKVEVEHGLALSRGLALDDHLDPSARALVDRRARERYARWRELRAGALTVEGVDLAAIWELELLAQCFLPAARVEVGLPRALETLGARGLVLRDVSGGLAAVLRAVAAAHGTSVREATLPPGMGTADTIGAHSGRPPLPVRVLSSTGVPGAVRGQVLCVPYWNLAPVYRRLAQRRSTRRPVASGVLLPGLDLGTRLGVAVKGGWLGHPGPLARRRSASDLARVIDAARDDGEGDVELDLALDTWALRLLRDKAGDTLAAARHARRAFSRGRVRSLLVPFDGPSGVAALVEEARRAGVPSLLVQHGFDARLGAPDKIRVDVAALWSERDRGGVSAESRSRLAVTGNPGAEHLAGGAGRVRRRDRTLVLVDYTSRLSARITERVGQLHVAAALEAISASRPGSTAVIRPHPSEQAPEAYLKTPSEIPVELDRGTPIENLMAEVDLCIGAMSTATLQAAAVGVPVVYLEVAGVDRPWPLNESAVPTARSARELAEAIPAAITKADVRGQAEMLEALGARSGATSAVCELIDELVS